MSWLTAWLFFIFIYNYFRRVESCNMACPSSYQEEEDEDDDDDDILSMVTVTSPRMSSLVELDPQSPWLVGTQYLWHWHSSQVNRILWSAFLKPVWPRTLTELPGWMSYHVTTFGVLTFGVKYVDTARVILTFWPDLQLLFYVIPFQNLHELPMATSGNSIKHNE